MKSRLSSTRKNTNIVQGKITCGVCNGIMHQKVNPKARIDLFICKNKSCKNSVNRSWLFKMVRLAVEEHVSKKDMDKELYEKEVNLLKLKISETEKQESKKQGAIMRTYRQQTKIIEDIGLEGYNDIIEGLHKDKKASKQKLETLNDELKTIVNGYNFRSKTFSKSLDKFKGEIRDILHSVLINNHEVVIRILRWRIYDIPKPNNTHLAWNKREENKFDIYKLPPHRNEISDEDLEMFISNVTDPNHDNAVDEYFQSDEYKKKTKGVASLGIK